MEKCNSSSPNTPRPRYAGPRYNSVRLYFKILFLCLFKISSLIVLTYFFKLNSNFIFQMPAKYTCWVQK